jgi:hypothetical protein
MDVEPDDRSIGQRTDLHEVAELIGQPQAEAGTGAL